MSSAAGELDEAAPVEHVVALLRERLYGAISCLATLAVRSAAPGGRDLLRIMQSSGQILQAALLPVTVLAVAAVADLNTSTATWVAMWILVAELAVITLLAVRRTELPWWQQALAVVVLAGVGTLVLVIKIVAH